MDENPSPGSESGSPAGPGAGPSGQPSRRQTAGRPSTGPAAQEPGSGPGTESQVIEPDPVVPKTFLGAFGIGPTGKGKGRRQTTGLTRGKSIKFETLTAKGAEKLARVFTTAFAKWKGDKWYASEPEIQEFGEAFSDMLEPFPALSQFVATYSAPLIFGGTVLGYMWLRQHGIFQPHSERLQVPVQPQPQRQTVTPPPPIRPVDVQPTAPQQQPQPTNGQQPVYSSVVDAAPLLSVMDN